MSDFVAGVHHLQIYIYIAKNVWKNVHGLREHDIDHKDKQNFNAALHIIVQALTLLDQLPDTAATKEFVFLNQYVSTVTWIKGSVHLQELKTGDFVAGVLYFQTLQAMFGKDVHGLREG